MIQLKSFTISEEGVKSFNKFVEKNPPRSTEKQSGVIFHTDKVLVIYDDGRDSPNEKIGTLRSILEGARNKKLLVDLKVETAQIALKEMKPKGYTKGLSDAKLKELIKSEGGDLLDYDTVKSIANNIANLENTILMDSHESRRLGYEIKANEELLSKSITN